MSVCIVFGVALTQLIDQPIYSLFMLRYSITINIAFFIPSFFIYLVLSNSLSHINTYTHKHTHAHYIIRCNIQNISFHTFCGYFSVCFGLLIIMIRLSSVCKCVRVSVFVCVLCVWTHTRSTVFIIPSKYSRTTRTTLSAFDVMVVMVLVNVCTLETRSLRSMCVHYYESHCKIFAFALLKQPAIC